MIDVDDLIRYLKLVTVTDGITFETGFKQILTDIKNQPTAYDVDKVVAELKHYEDEISKTYVNGFISAKDYHLRMSTITACLVIVTKGLVDGYSKKEES